MNLPQNLSFKIIFFLVIASIFMITCSTEQEKMTNDFKQFLMKYEKKVIPLTKEANLAYFRATTTGQDELYQKLEEIEVELSQIYANKDEFKRLKKIKEVENGNY